MQKTGKLARDKKIQKQLETLLGKTRNKGVLLYLPLPFESDLGPLLKRLRNRHRFYVPFMEGVSFKMVPYRLPLKKFEFDIRQPGYSLFNKFKIDFAVVPVVGIDDNFKRVGFGKGMYDRFFDALGYRPRIIFVQPVFCRCHGKVSAAHDIDGDVLITPGRLFFKRKKGFLKNVIGNDFRRRGNRRHHLFCHTED